ncbi:Nuclear hormone receptor family member nhr-34 [Aphelenchoides besseyi]|nr:Nuclear hormone receptor family member nhr-34 [Aphelenchoides besseyi]
MESRGCQICNNEKASIHYGGRCCLRCKTFFRRTLKSNAKYKCDKNNDCEIVGSGRQCCKACRLNRCFATQMDPKLVQSDRKPPPNVRRSEQSFSSNESFSPHSSVDSMEIANRFSLVEVNKTLNFPYEGPLAYKSPLELPSTNDFRSLLKYFNEVDRFVDEYYDTGLSHTSHFKDYNINLSIQEAFMISPRRLSSRTKILWQPNHWVTSESIGKVFCRTIVHYIDLSSHIPELQLMEPEDKLRLLVSRAMTFCGLTAMHRTFKYAKKRCVLTTGGGYMPLEIEELVRFRTLCIGDKTLSDSVQSAVMTYDTFVGPMRDLQLTDDEFVLLRLISFFVQTQKLSQEAREIVRTAQSYYQSLLIQYLCSKYERTYALQRLTDILSFIPIIENQVAIRDNQMIAATLFNSDLKGTLTHDFFILRTMRG